MKKFLIDMIMENNFDNGEMRELLEK